MNSAIPFGRCLEDFAVGDVYEHLPGKTITESDNNLFCLLTMNHHPVHLDTESPVGLARSRLSPPVSVSWVHMDFTGKARSCP